MNCTACGNEITGTPAFCPFCGTPVGAAAGAPQAGAAPTGAPPAGAPPIGGGAPPLPPLSAALPGEAAIDLTTFPGALAAALKMVMLDRAAIRKIVATPDATKWGLLIIAIVGALSAIGSLHPFLLVVGPIMALVFSAIVVAVAHVVATILGGRGDFVTLYRSYGFMDVVGAVGVVPFLGPFLAMLAGLWCLVVLVPTLEESHRMTREKAILTAAILLGLGILFAIVVAVIAILAGATIFGALLGAAQQ